MATESLILDNHLATANAMAKLSPWAFDGGSGPCRASASAQPARWSARLGEAHSTRPGRQHSELVTDTVHFSSHTLITPLDHQSQQDDTKLQLYPFCHLPPMHPVGAQFSLPSQIWTKLWILPVSAVYHFEIYTILAERTELYCIHDAIKHFTRNQCKTDEAWK